MIPEFLSELQWASTPISPKGGAFPVPELLAFRTSLTLEMERRWGPVEITVLQEGVDVMRPAAIRLGLAPGKGYTREVLIRSQGQPVVAAVSMLSLASFQGYFQGIGSLGNHYLGSLLFNTDTHRSPFQYSLLDLTNSRALQVALHQEPCKACRLWVRRSVFSHNTDQLTLIEIFLPGPASEPAQER